MWIIRFNICVWIFIFNLLLFGLKFLGDGGKRFISKVLRVVVWVVICKNYVIFICVMM